MSGVERGNYDSGEAFVLAYGAMHFTFSEEDFKERVEYAAKRLRLIETALNDAELDDLASLVVEDEIAEPKSPLADHIDAHHDELFADNGSGQPALTHWLKRLVFRGAYLDQLVLSGELDVDFDMQTGDFNYVQAADPNRSRIEIAPAPSWHHVLYHPQSY